MRKKHIFQDKCHYNVRKCTKVYWCRPKWGSFSIYNGDGSENVTQRVNSRCFGFFAIIPSPIISVSNVDQFFWSWILKVLSKLGKRKNKSFSCVHVLHKTWIWEVSRSSRATTAKKWTKNVIHVQSKLLFCRFRYRHRCWSNKSSPFTSVNILYCFIRVRLTVQVLVVPSVHLQ